MEVLMGAEVAITRIGEIPAEDISMLHLGGGPWLLAEPPFSQVAAGLEALVADLQRRGHRILLAHPERCAAFHREPRLLESLVGSGVLTSITAGSLVGSFGGQVRRFALELARGGMVHNVASDAHDETKRPPGMVREIEQAGLGPLADWLTQAVPEAILDGRETIPRPPRVTLAGARGAGRTWWRRRGSGS
jgi:protein-tyrosine phosphatase